MRLCPRTVAGEQMVVLRDTDTGADGDILIIPGADLSVPPSVSHYAALILSPVLIYGRPQVTAGRDLGGSAYDSLFDGFTILCSNSAELQVSTV